MFAQQPLPLFCTLNHCTTDCTILSTIGEQDIAAQLHNAKGFFDSFIDCKEEKNLKYLLLYTSKKNQFFINSLVNIMLQC